MKNFTPALVKTGKIKTTFKTFFLGNSIGAKANYYSARHKTEDIYILWIETARFGKSYCFPCVLEEQGDPMVYITGRGSAQNAKNNALVQRWGLFVTPASFEENYNCEEMTSDNFYTEYSKYKDIILCREIEAMGNSSEAINARVEAIEQAAGPAGENDEAEAAEEEPETARESDG